MMKLTDAITNRFPQGNEWAAQALAALSGDFEPTTLVHDVAEGWMRRGAGADAELVDTLFILTNDRLGLGQTSGGPGTPHWVPLTAIVAVDAVDDSPLPLQTIELVLQDGLEMCVGWPDTFSERLVDVLIALAEGEALDDPDGAMPRELAEPEAVVDVSDLDSLSPSEWVEQPVAVVADAPASDAPAHEAPVADAPVEDGQRRIVAALDFFNTPKPAVEPQSFEAPLPEPLSLDHTPAPDPDAPRFMAPPPGEDPWLSLEPHHDVAPLAPDAFEVLPPLEFESVSAVPSGTPVADSGELPPWNRPGVVWPDPLRGVLYLGGHPAHPRKRKNGTMIFSPKGLEVNGSGFQSWEMSIDWAYVNGIEIQGPDEIMFGDHLKIDSASSALVVTMVDETRMFFEVRTRRPPSLRAALAPVLQTVDNIRVYRANA